MMVGANDVEQSKVFYDAVLGALGYEPGVLDDKGRVFYFTPSGIFSITKPINGEYFSTQNRLPIQPFGGKEIEFFADFGKRIDFDNSRLANGLSLQPELQFNLGKYLEMCLRHTYEKLDTRNTDENIFTANLSDIRLTWQFNVRSFLRLVVQHQDIKRDPALYIDEVDGRSRSLATQLLYSYKVNPQTVLFLGYSDAAEDGDMLSSFTKTNQTLFAKIGYAWLP